MQIEFILDASGSMQDKVGSETKLAYAIEAILAAINSLPEGSLAALRVYGHRESQDNKEKSCKDTELILPFKAQADDTLSQRLESLKPLGYTPLAYALAKAKDDFSASRRIKKHIVLLSDGEETCGGNPVAVVEQLRKSGFSVQIHSIGYQVSGIAKKQLEAIAKMSGGSYFSAISSVKLSEIVLDATFKALGGAKQLNLRGDLGERKDAGSSKLGALPLAVGKYPKNFLGKHDKKDTFAFKAKVGEKFQFSVRPEKSGDRTIQLRVFDNNNDELMKQTSTAGQALESEVVEVGKSGTHYLELECILESTAIFSYELEFRKLVDY